MTRNHEELHQSAGRFDLRACWRYEVCSARIEGARRRIAVAMMLNGRLLITPVEVVISL